MKNILLCTTGATPQVLTETLYALHTQGKTFPDEMFVITTENAKELLVQGLFVEGHLQTLIDEYSMPEVVFDESHIWVIGDENGKPLIDAKREEDQAHMADFITSKVAELTADENCAIHASIAGGRKTMAFYMGYAMSLLGREQDALSHVFINDEFEFVPDFYYPTKEDNWIEGKGGQKLNTKDATVTLAEIPFVRMRKKFEGDLIGQIEQASFSKTVAMMNSSDQAKTAQISPTAMTLSVHGVDIKLTAKELALYQYLTQEPGKTVTVDRQFVESVEPSKAYLSIYSLMKGDARVYKTFGLEDEIAWNTGELDNLKPMEKEFVQPIRTYINRKLKEKLPAGIFEKVQIHSKRISGGNIYWIDEDLQVTEIFHP
ncbi:CRISPR-associated ring nuclease Csm6 [Photobacterium rosenbergii]|uniref:CRISPR-associated ring nuclease Csm6 n=1 Tax=Photobacterium rosenbergii TaxID=294936 RepID=UPI001C9A0CD3|nr:CRISPR-associated ring nuclease Csm6 [Photobacterium rosenbergii]MBY5946838.1 TIGR02584 family CRISPR-associated protein [Photobacterium rosenbergii]